MYGPLFLNVSIQRSVLNLMDLTEGVRKRKNQGSARSEMDETLKRWMHYTQNEDCFIKNVTCNVLNFRAFFHAIFICFPFILSTLVLRSASFLLHHLLFLGICNHHQCHDKVHGNQFCQENLDSSSALNIFFSTL
ncbi:hypothetical protein T11_7705 [Trichinella zimbabwensis]|uniref:Uncharacterized protein n=1 Tax=Trichinella zimbabwensis TaxID=268475 RepID=A0A0V1GV28_9BILA|nr:hypothetical protein T11_7705 [Trichinella zimbabwensis]